MTAKNQQNLSTSSSYVSITEAAKVEKIVDYSFERNEKSNVLAIHPTRPLIAYLINIQRTPKISKGWSSGNDSIAQSPSSSIINGQGTQSADKNKTVSIRIIDYRTRQRCLAKGIYHARPTDCVFAINSLLCSQNDVVKMAVVDKLANIYLYDLTYFLKELSATRIAVIRSPHDDISPYDCINLVWCPFVPCEDFDDGDGGLRLALSTNSRIEIFAIDRLQGKTGEMSRSDLRGAYKCFQDAHNANITSLSISPDCSTLSAAALDNRVTFFSSDIDDNGQRPLHNWEANMIDSPISTLLFLDDYPKLLEDSTMQFWGAAFLGTTSGQMLLINLRTWTVYQKLHLNPEGGSKNFEYRIDLTSRNIVAINGNQCYIIQIEHDYSRLSSQSSTTSNKVGSNQSGVTQNDISLLDSSQSDLMNGNIFNYLLSKSATAASPRQNQKQANKKPSTNSGAANATSGLPKIVKTTRLSLHTPVYSFVIKNKSDEELEMFTISAYSLELYIINLNALEPKIKAPEPIQQLKQQAASAVAKQSVSITSAASSAVAAHQHHHPHQQQPPPHPPKGSTSVATGGGTVSVDVSQMDRMVEILFNKLNTSFSQGLDEFLGEVKSEVNDLKSKLNVVCREMNKLQQQLHEARQK